MNFIQDHPSFDVRSVATKLERSLPPSFLATHPDFVSNALCGILFRNGIEDSGRIEAISGKSIEQTVFGIADILADPESSVRYFAALDQFEAELGFDH